MFICLLRVGLATPLTLLCSCVQETFLCIYRCSLVPNRHLIVYGQFWGSPVSLIYFDCLRRYLSAQQSLILKQDESSSESPLLALWKRWTLRESARIGHYQVSSYTTMVAKSPLWWCLHFIGSRNSSAQNFRITWFRSPARLSITDWMDSGSLLFIMCIQLLSVLSFHLCHYITIYTLMTQLILSFTRQALR